MRARIHVRHLLFVLLAALIAAAIPVLAAETGFAVNLDTSQAQPRHVEETTMTSVQRDYGHAWQTMAAAMEENNTGLLGSDFVGLAKEQLSQVISEQGKSGLKRRYIDHGHQVRVVFYSPDGSAMELHDTVRLEIQLLDGNKIVYSDQGTFHFLALMTPAENSWKVRLLESVSGF
ncbi:MAG: hypothetical protein ABSD96_08630 [Candidatus Korobacteraceae bacterium]|jgi:hypothetical protein